MGLKRLYEVCHRLLVKDRRLQGILVVFRSMVIYGFTELIYTSEIYVSL